MYFNAEQLKNIEEMAYQLFSPFEIALALETEEADEFIEEIGSPGTDAHKAFYKGYFRQLGELRTDTIKAARNGSNPAQIELLKCITNIQRELLHG